MTIDVEGLTKNKNMKMTDEEIEKAVRDYFHKLARENKEMVKVLSKRDFIASLKEIVEVSKNKNHSDKLKEKMLDNFVEAYAPAEREMFKIQDLNIGEYIVKREKGQEFPFTSVSEEEFEHVQDEDKYFSVGELRFIKNGSYKTTSVGKW